MGIRDCCDTVTEVIIFLPAKRGSSAVSHVMSKRFPCRSWSECEDPSQSEQMVAHLHGHRDFEQWMLSWGDFSGFRHLDLLRCSASSSAAWRLFSPPVCKISALTVELCKFLRQQHSHQLMSLMQCATSTLMKVEADEFRANGSHSFPYWRTTNKNKQQTTGSPLNPSSDLRYFISTSGLAITVKQAKKKWNNLEDKYKELRDPPTGKGVEAGSVTAAT
ncbi:hypothetical protein G5714_004438 [Onychostoma macrolepis]|uniref:Uncharacterized protein n=1 Tax=Onychostoma macrolepis TaxID=369639 RepID=A0A7J6D578_9TELE|nr:hypothetical protein G5714_004438 [Onychostoma macrolepis]